MQGMVMIECGIRGLLYVNGQFCGPVDGEGQAFPAGRHSEIFVQLFPFGEGTPLAAEMILRDGHIARLAPKSSCFALEWPDGVIQLELRPQGGAQEEMAQQEMTGVLLRYLNMRLSGDERASALLMQPRDQAVLPDISGYYAAVPLRFAPLEAGSRYDERAGLVMRIGENVARVDAALAVTLPAGIGKRMIERIDILRT